MANTVRLAMTFQSGIFPLPPHAARPLLLLVCVAVCETLLVVFLVIVIAVAAVTDGLCTVDELCTVDGLCKVDEMSDPGCDAD